MSKNHCELYCVGYSSRLTSRPVPFTGAKAGNCTGGKPFLMIAAGTMLFVVLVTSVKSGVWLIKRAFFARQVVSLAIEETGSGPDDGLVGERVRQTKPRGKVVVVLFAAAVR